MITDIFRGEQPIASVAADIITVSAALTGFANITDTLTTLGDQCLALIQNASGSAWELSTLENVGVNQFSRVPIKSTNSNALIDLSAGGFTVSSVAVPANFLPDTTNKFNFNRGNLCDFGVLSADYTAAREGGITLDLSIYRAAHIKLYGFALNGIVFSNSPSSACTVMLLIEQNDITADVLDMPVNWYSVDGNSLPQQVLSSVSMLLVTTTDGGTTWYYKFMHDKAEQLELVSAINLLNVNLANNSNLGFYTFMTENTELQMPTNYEFGEEFVLEVTQDATTPYTFSASAAYQCREAIAIPATLGAVTVFRCHVIDDTHVNVLIS